MTLQVVRYLTTCREDSLAGMVRNGGHMSGSTAGTDTQPGRSQGDLKARVGASAGMVWAIPDGVTLQYVGGQ